MKKAFLLALVFLAGLLLVGCRKQKEPAVSGKEVSTLYEERIGKTSIRLGDVTDFYYTYDWVGFNARYQRYRFYTEDGKKRFYHETREIIDGYGWATEENITKSGTVELSEEEWLKFLEFLKDGTARKRQESAESGDAGPWMYVYSKKGPKDGMEFFFEPRSGVLSFEEFCSDLAEGKG